MTILGIDEVGRGPWAGPLVVGAVILGDPKNKLWAELADSKKLTQKKREALIVIIENNAVATGLGWVSAKELDKIGLAESLKVATRRAVVSLLDQSPYKDPDQNLSKSQHQNPLKDLFRSPSKDPSQKQLPTTSDKLPFSEIIIDGTSNFLKGTALESLVTVLPKADAKIKEVSAASIIAKVARDNYMRIIAEQFPKYGFEKHVGYGTKQHSESLQKYGPCPEHRLSFKPVQKVFQNRTITKTKNSSAKANKATTATTATKANKATKVETSNARVTHGARAEQIVADYLEKNQQHTILARNHKTRFYEIDIVSATKDHIYFTEVKYRENEEHGTPLEFIDKKKQKQIEFAAESFMQYLSKKLERPVTELPSPIIAVAAVSGKQFKLDKWLPVIV